MSMKQCCMHSISILRRLRAQSKLESLCVNIYRIRIFDSHKPILFFTHYKQPATCHQLLHALTCTPTAYCFCRIIGNPVPLFAYTLSLWYFFKPVFMFESMYLKKCLISNSMQQKTRYSIKSYTKSRHADFICNRFEY